MSRACISADDPLAEDVRGLLRRHLEFARSNTPPEDVHALDIDGLLHPAITFCSCRRDGELLAVGAIKLLNDGPVRRLPREPEQHVHDNGTLTTAQTPGDPAGQSFPRFLAARMIWVTSQELTPSFCAISAGRSPCSL